MILIDSHCHIDFDAFDTDRAEVLKQCQQHGIERLIVPGVSEKHWQKQIHLCHEHSQLALALGLHPLFIEDHQESDLVTLETLIQQHHPIAVGEIGLDFYHDKNASEKQISFFQAQLKLAKQFDLPVILHVRKAHDETLKYLRQFALKGGVVHAFSGSEQQAQHYIKLGFKLGIGGALTYDRAHKLHKLFSTLPLEAIVLETDAPDMPLSGKQGQRNSPAYLPLVLDKLTTIRPENKQQIAQTLTTNTKRLFQL